jgi:hypothetical protein
VNRPHSTHRLHCLLLHLSWRRDDPSRTWTVRLSELPSPHHLEWPRRCECVTLLKLFGRRPEVGAHALRK